MTPTELVQMSLSRLERLDPVLNAFVHVDAERALLAAGEATRRQLEGRRLGPLDGIPVAVKDNLFVAGMPSRWGSLLFRDHAPPQDDICVERLRRPVASLSAKRRHLSSRSPAAPRVVWPV